MDVALTENRASCESGGNPFLREEGELLEAIATAVGEGIPCDDCSVSDPFRQIGLG